MELTHLCSTGIFRVAGAGLSALWGSSSPADQDAEEPPPPDPEVKLRQHKCQICQNLIKWEASRIRDHLKAHKNIQSCPNFI